MSFEEKFQEAERHRVNVEYDSALPIYREILAEKEDHVNVRVALGMTLGFMGEFDDSVAELIRATEYGPNSSWAWLNL